MKTVRIAAEHQKIRKLIMMTWTSD
jgi:hypothetical protein